MKLLLDEHFSHLIAQQLREQGFDVVAITERPGLMGAPDAEVFAAAVAQRRALVTNDARHLIPLAQRHAAEGGRHFGLVLTSDRSLPRSRRRIGATVRALAAMLRTRDEVEALADQVVWLSAKR